MGLLSESVKAIRLNLGETQMHHRSQPTQHKTLKQNRNHGLWEKINFLIHATQSYLILTVAYYQYYLKLTRFLKNI